MPSSVGIRRLTNEHVSCRACTIPKKKPTQTLLNACMAACLASHGRRVASMAQAWKGVLMPADWTIGHCGIDPSCAKQGTQARVRTPWCTGSGSTVDISARVRLGGQMVCQRDVPPASGQMSQQQSDSRTESCRTTIQRHLQVEGQDWLPESLLGGTWIETDRSK